MSSTDWYTEYSAEAHDLIAGTIGGCSGVFIGQPFDLVKVRIQCNLSINNSVFQTASHIAKNEGLLAFWKGIIPPILANVPINAIGFASYGSSQRFLTGLLQKHNPVPTLTTHFDGTDYLVPMGRPSFEAKEAFLNDLNDFNFLTEQQEQTQNNNEYMQSQLQSPLQSQSQSHSNSQYHQNINKLQKKYPHVDFTLLRNVQNLNEIDSISIYNSSPNAHKTDLNWHMAIFLAGCWSGLLSCLFSAPSELLKIQEQNYQGQGKITSFSLAKTIAQKHGVFSLFRGFWATVLRDCPSVGVYFWVYEFCKWSLRTESFVPTSISSSSASSASSASSQNSPFISNRIVWNQQINYDFKTPLIAGSIAGPCSWLSTYPIDCVKSRLQTLSHDEYKKTSMIKVFRDTVKKEGYTFFVRGLSTTLVRSVPVNAITFLFYEKTLELCKDKRFLMSQHD